MFSHVAAVLRFGFGDVQRVPVRILEVGDEELRVVDDVATKDDAACLERRDRFADGRARAEADRYRADAAGRVLRRRWMKANRQPVTAVNRCPVVAVALEQLQLQGLGVE